MCMCVCVFDSFSWLNGGMEDIQTQDDGAYSKISSDGHYARQEQPMFVY